MNTELVHVAAKWWADHLRTRPTMDAGHAGNSFILSIQARDNTDLDELSISLFELALRTQVELCAKSSSNAVIKVDYEPCDELAHAAQVAGINLNHRLPVKTVMVIEDQSVVCVKVGYGKPYEVIYTAVQ